MRLVGRWGTFVEVWSSRVLLLLPLQNNSCIWIGMKYVCWQTRMKHRIELAIQIDSETSSRWKLGFELEAKVGIIRIRSQSLLIGWIGNSTRQITCLIIKN